MRHATNSKSTASGKATAPKTRRQSRSIDNVSIDVGAVSSVPGGGEVSAFWNNRWPAIALSRRVRELLVRDRELTPCEEAAIGEAIATMADDALFYFRAIDLPDLAQLWIETAIEIAARRAIERAADSGGESQPIVGRLIAAAQQSREAWQRSVSAATARDVREHLARKSVRIGRPRRAQALSDEENRVVAEFDALEKKKRKPTSNALKLQARFPKILDGTSDPLKRIRRLQKRAIEAGQ